MIVMAWGERESIRNYFYDLYRAVVTENWLNVEMLDSTDYFMVLATSDRSENIISELDTYGCEVRWLSYTDIENIELDKNDIRIYPFVTYTHRTNEKSTRQTGRVVTHPRTVISAKCQARRSSADNEKIAIDILKLKLAVAHEIDGVYARRQAK